MQARPRDLDETYVLEATNNIRAVCRSKAAPAHRAALDVLTQVGPCAPRARASVSIGSCRSDGSLAESRRAWGEGGRLVLSIGILGWTVARPRRAALRAGRNVLVRGGRRWARYVLSSSSRSRGTLRAHFSGCALFISAVRVHVCGSLSRSLDIFVSVGSRVEANKLAHGGCSCLSQTLGRPGHKSRVAARYAER